MLKWRSRRTLVLDPEQLVVAGERHHSANIQSLVESNEGRLEVHCVAQLLWERDNLHDPDAVAVVVDGLRVGYISRRHSADLRLQLNGEVLELACVVHWNGEKTDGIYDVKLFPPL